MRGEFAVKYAGLIADINPSIDPSGRTDLLRILDTAEISGAIHHHHYCQQHDDDDDGDDDARLTIDSSQLKIAALNDPNFLHLIAPLHMVASVGYVRDHDVNIVAVRIGIPDDVDEEEEGVENSNKAGTSSSQQLSYSFSFSRRPTPMSDYTYDLAVLYTRTQAAAEEICAFVDACFQRVYREAMCASVGAPLAGMLDSSNSCCSTKKKVGRRRRLDLTAPRSGKELFSEKEEKYSSTTIPSASPMATANMAELPSSRLLLERRREGESRRFLRMESTTAASSSSSSSTSASSESSRDTVDLVNDYIATLSAHLSHAELGKFAVLMRRWRAKELPILEFAQKLLELYGTERKHLLGKMRTLLQGLNDDEMSALSNFFCANGVVGSGGAGERGRMR